MAERKHRKTTEIQRHPARHGRPARLQVKQRRPDGSATSFDIIGLPARPLSDLYHQLLVASWPQLFALMISFYLALNAVFAVGYWLDRGSIDHADPDSFADAFFFSVQTLATIGYGVMSPHSTLSHILVTIQAFAGVLFTALSTGLMFAKFSRPTARVMFSKFAVVAPRNGVPMLMFRVANARGNRIVEARMQVALVRDERTLEGETMRRFADLPLVRAQNIAFALTWTVMHEIDENSPLFGPNLEKLRTQDAGLVAVLTGLDETMAQPVHARNNYSLTDILWNHRLVDTFLTAPDGRRSIDMGRFDDVEALTPSPPLPEAETPGTV